MISKKPNLNGSLNYSLVNDKLFILWNNIDLTPASIPPQKWTEPDGTDYFKNKKIDYNTTRHSTFLYAITENGIQTYSKRFYGLPLFNLHKGSPFQLSMNPNIFYTAEDGIIILANMHDDLKRYRFGRVKLD